MPPYSFLHTLPFRIFLLRHQAEYLPKLLTFTGSEHSIFAAKPRVTVRTMLFKGSRVSANQMKNSVDIQTSQAITEVLETISAATEREILPFVSASRYPIQTEKTFVAKVSGHKFRIWKVPSGSKTRRTRHVYLSGEVRNVGGGTHLLGAFAVHPFHKILALIPAAVIALVWWLGHRTVPELIFMFGFLAFDLAMIGAAIHSRPAEEAELKQFLERLLWQQSQQAQPAE